MGKWSRDGAKILAHSKNVNAAAAEVAENLDQFLGGFAESDHHATLGYHAGENFLAFSSSVRVRW